MDVGGWWPKVTEATQVWLLQNNGSPLPADVSADIAAAGGPTVTELADEDVDWIEAVANGEDPS